MNEFTGDSWMDVFPDGDARLEETGHWEYDWKKKYFSLDPPFIFLLPGCQSMSSSS